MHNFVLNFPVVLKDFLNVLRENNSDIYSTMEYKKLNELISKLPEEYQNSYHDMIFDFILEASC